MNPDFDYMFKQCTKFVLPAMPDGDCGDILRPLKEGLFGTAGEIGVSDETWAGGHSLGHSLLTAGVIHEVHRRLWEREPDRELLCHMSVDTMRYLLREPGVRVGLDLPWRKWFSVENLLEASGIQAYGLSITTRADWPRWRLERRGEKWGFFRRNPGDEMWDYAPYTGTVIEVPCGWWFIMHRLPCLEGD